MTTLMKQSRIKGASSRRFGFFVLLTQLSCLLPITMRLCDKTEHCSESWNVIYLTGKLTSEFHAIIFVITIQCLKYLLERILQTHFKPRDKAQSKRAYRVKCNESHTNTSDIHGSPTYTIYPGYDNKQTKLKILPTNTRRRTHLWYNRPIIRNTYLLRGLSLQANYIDRATAACRRMKTITKPLCIESHH
jgi:hypothetical protein